MNTHFLWRELGKNTLISLAVFTALLGVLLAVEHFFPQLSLLNFSSAAFCVGIPASVIGVGYVLTIRNPLNYTGFYAGILMSVLLAVQFLLQGNYDLVVLQMGVFVPFQTMSIVSWKRNANRDSGDENNKVSPSYLSRKQQIITICLVLLIVVIDYLLATYILQCNTLLENIAIKLMGALMIASSVMSNYWLIYKKVESWLYWVIYSVAGIGFYILIGNAFNIVLFTFFLVVNGMAGFAWMKFAKSK